MFSVELKSLARRETELSVTLFLFELWELCFLSLSAYPMVRSSVSSFIPRVLVHLSHSLLDQDSGPWVVSEISHFRISV